MIAAGERITVACSWCAGTGRVELTGEYRATLDRLAALGREVSGAELGRLMGVAPTAMSNRLDRLEDHGLVTSRRHGRKRLFRAKRPAEPEDTR